jgi:hypothetical protein
LQTLKQRLSGLLTTNTTAPELERLDKDEFLVDTEEKSRLDNEMQKSVKAVRRSIELQNLKKRVLRDRFKVHLFHPTFMTTA